MYLNVIQLAESFGVEENVVESWVQNEGLPAIEDRGRLLFDRAQVVDWAAQRGRVANAGFLAATPSGGTDLESLLRVGGIWRDVPAAELMPLLVKVVERLPGTTPAVKRILAQRAGAHEGITWTPVGGGFALPHLRAHVALGRASGLLAILLLREPLSLQEPPVDGVPVTRLLFFVAPSPRAHLELLAQLSGALTRGTLRQMIGANASDLEIFNSLKAGPAEPPVRKETGR